MTQQRPEADVYVSGAMAGRFAEQFALLAQRSGWNVSVAYPGGGHAYYPSIGASSREDRLSVRVEVESRGD